METGRAKESEHVGDEVESSLEGEEEWAHCSSSATSDGDRAGVLTSSQPERRGWI